MSKAKKFTQHIEIPQIVIMTADSAPTSPVSTRSHSRSQSRDTGFPDYLNGLRNTNLPHPSANTSPNASISQADVSFDFVRSRRHTLIHKHRRTISSGTVSPLVEALRSTIPLTMGDVHMSPIKITSEPEEFNGSSSTTGTTQAGSQSFESKRDEDTPPASPDLSNSLSRRRSIFGKWKRRGA